MKKQAIISVLLGFSVIAAAPASAFSLKDAVERTLQSNPDVLIDTYERKSRDHELDQARAGYKPTLDLSAGIGRERSDNPSTRAAGNDSVTLTRREAGLQARQMLFDGFATSNEVDRQAARIESSAYRIYGTAEATALRAAELYLEVLRREELLDLAKNNYDMHEEIHDRIQRRSRSGVGRRADLDQVSGRLALAKSNVIAEDTNLRDADTNYLRVIGSLPEIGMTRPELIADVIPATLEEAVEMAVASHPTLKSAEADIKATQAQHEASKHTNYPKLHLELEGNWNDNLDGQEGRNDDALAMLRLRYNLYNGGKDMARQEQTLHLIDESKAVRNRTYRQVVESMRLSWNAYQANTKQLEFLKEHVEASSKTREAYAKQFNIGKRSLLDLLDSENEYFEASRAYVTAQYSQLLDQYRVLAGMGALVETLGIAAPAGTALPEESASLFADW